MTKIGEGNNLPTQGEHSPRRVRLPGFILDEEIALGDAIKRATSYIGIKPAVAGEKRAAALNRWLVFTKRPQM
ncbi:MAG: hypothetical protein R2867_32265 [Caldilineaceae bacterium]